MANIGSYLLHLSCMCIDIACIYVIIHTCTVSTEPFESKLQTWQLLGFFLSVVCPSFLYCMATFPLWALSSCISTPATCFKNQHARETPRNFEKHYFNVSVWMFADTACNLVNYRLSHSQCGYHLINRGLQTANIVGISDVQALWPFECRTWTAAKIVGI